MPNKFQRREQQGCSAPIISWHSNGMRYVVVGGKVYCSSNWLTFQDFLVDFAIDILGKDWFTGELNKSVGTHQIVQWYRITNERKQQDAVDGRAVYPIKSVGGVNALISFCYNLYLVAHNSTLLQEIVKRIKNSAEFHGVYYELFVAAQFIKSGFIIDYDFESGRSFSKCEFVAKRYDNGKMYSVEAKARHLAGTLGGNAGTNQNIPINVIKQLRKALSKNADYSRVVFIDTNFPDNTSCNSGIDILKYISGAIQNEEETLLINQQPAPPAYIFLTNFPYHYRPDDQGYQCSAIAIGFKYPDFRYDSSFDSLEQALGSRDRHKDMFDLFDWMRRQDVPATFDGESPEFAFSPCGTPRLLIGNQYIIPDKDGAEVVGVLETACVIENDSTAFGCYRLENGRRILATCELSAAELDAYRRHPDTFFGKCVQAPRFVVDGIGLFDALYETYKKTPKDKLLEFMSNFPDINRLRSLPQRELARLYCLHIAEMESGRLG